ncbi:uncharacterized protein LOC128394031 [Panonychus citri]|uniref:uncharacterized protein LOC128394031 n=1 Tax=Panonychus citri TaxID=50023 RepID=UPI002306EB66|nr:uncharacterized protein LOC128394031 [Panonychus citri]
MSFSSSAIAFYKLNSLAKIPRRSTVNAAGWDLYAIESKKIEPWSRELIGTGLAFDMPKGVYGRIASRSSFALRGLDVGAGVIDPDFHGEVKVLIINNNNVVQTINQGERFSQIIFEPYHEPKEVLIFKHFKNVESHCDIPLTVKRTKTDSDSKEGDDEENVLKTVEKITVHMAKPSDGVSKFYFYSDRDLFIEPNERVVYSTKIGLSMPDGIYAHLIGSKLLADYGVDVIDTIIKKNSTKEINIIFHNRNNHVYTIVEGIPIAQVHFKSYSSQLDETDEMPAGTSRDASGFGSTGRN